MGSEIRTRNGILYANTNNLGDDIQALAALQFADGEPFFVNRECLAQYKTEQSKIKLVMNGWFMHRSFMWPPSEVIDPLFVSFHITSTAQKSLLSKKSLQYLERYQPIGARDMHTRDLLTSAGIDSYFSGCLTLTLGYKYGKRSVERNNILVIDVPNRMKIALQKHSSDIQRYGDLVFTTQVMKECGSLLDKYKALQCEQRGSPRKFLSFDPYRTLVNFNCLLNTCCAQRVEERLAHAERRLLEIKQAKLVVTSRLHVALPAIALGTPLIFVIKDPHDPRFSGYEDLLLPYSVPSASQNVVDLISTHLASQGQQINISKLQSIQQRLISTVSNFFNRSPEKK